MAALPRSPTTAFSLSFLQSLQILRKVCPLGIDACAKALWAYHGQRDDVYLAEKSLKKRRLGPLRFWSALAALVRLNSESSKSLRLWNTHFRVDHVNQSRRRDLLLWVKSRFKSTEMRLIQNMSVLKEVGRKGLSEGKLTREWEDQKKTQEDEGQIEASVERRRKYEKLGELLSLWDRVKGISKELKTSAAPGSEKLKEAERLLENLLNKEKECGGD
ncbi:hypothetical protein IAS59_006000 [Cryptococcus gattii]